MSIFVVRTKKLFDMQGLAIASPEKFHCEMSYLFYFWGRLRSSLRKQKNKNVLRNGQKEKMELTKF